MPEEILFETESRQSRADVAEYLRSIADLLDADGELTLQAGEQSLSMSVPETVTFEVKAERETPASGGSGELGLELELEWDEDGESDGSLNIE